MAILKGDFDGKKRYLRIDSNGYICEAVKEEDKNDKCVPNINPVTNQQNGYKMLYSYGITGYLDAFGITQIKNSQGVDVKAVLLSLRDYEENEKYIFTFPIFGNNGRLHRYVQTFLQIYPNIDISRMLKFNAARRKSDEKYAPSGLFISYADDPNSKLIPHFYKKDQNGWPPMELIQDEITGAEKWSSKAQTKFAYERLMEMIAEFKDKSAPIRNALMEKYKVNVSHHTSDVPEAPRSYTREDIVTEDDTPAEEPVVHTREVQAPREYVDPEPKNEPEPPVKNAKPANDYEEDLPF